MKTFYRLLTLCVCAGFIFLYVDGQQHQGDVSAPEHAAADNHQPAVVGHKAADSHAMEALVDPMVKIQKAEKSLVTLKESYKDEDLLLELLDNPRNADSDVHQVYAELIGGYEERIVNDVEVDDILPKNAGLSRTMIVTVVDAVTGEPIPGVTIYMWGARLGATPATGELKVTKSLPRSHDVINFEAHKRGYSRGYQSHNGLYHDGSEIHVSFKLNPSTVNVVTTTVEDFNVDAEDLTIDIKDDCPLVNAFGQCHKGTVEVEYNYIDAHEVEQTSIPMRAIHNGEVRRLVSNGMAMTDFYDEDGMPLTYTKKKGKVCYKVGQEQIDTWNQRLKADDGQEGYRYFHRASGYWKYDANAKVTVENGEFCAETVHIY